MEWLILSIGAIAFFSCLNLLMRVLAVKSENPRAFSFMFNVFAGLFALIIILLQPVKISFDFPLVAIALVLAATFLYGIFERLQFYARKHIDASTFVILFRITPVVTFITSIIFLGEEVTIPKLLGLIAIIAGSILVVYKKFSVKLDKALLLTLICAVALGLGWTIDKRATEFFDPQLYTSLIWTLPLIFIFAPYISLKDLKNEFKISSWKIVLLAFLNVAGYYLQLKALSLADASTVIPLISATTIFTVIGGVVFLKERDHLLTKTAATILVIIGMLLLI